MSSPHSAPLSIAPVSTRRERERLLRLPWRVYAEYPAWVPPLLLERRQVLSPRHNPFLQRIEAQLFLARRGDEVVGSIAAFIDPRVNDLYQEAAGSFGFFEVLPDAEAAAALLRAAEEWCRARGMHCMRGPHNFSYDNECGLLVKGYDREPVLMTLYSPPYYTEFVECSQYTRLVDWSAYNLPLPARVEDLPPRMERVRDIARRRSGVTLRPVRLHDFANELARVQQVYNQAWEHNWGFVPMDDAEVAALARGLRSFVDPELVLIAEVDGQVVGASITLPDLNQIFRRMNGRLLPAGWWYLLRRQRYISRGRIFALGVLPAYRQRGIEAAFIVETFRAAILKGYRELELSIVVEHNTATHRSIAPLKDLLGGDIARIYRIYEKLL
jgi:GNAT superfamily N-acetyltransferase